MVGMVKRMKKPYIIFIFLLCILFLGNVNQFSTIRKPLRSQKDSNLSKIKPKFTVQSTGIITEDLDDFYAGTMENVTLTPNGFLRLERETTNRIWTYTGRLTSLSSERYGHAMIYDSLAAKFILFGGDHFGTRLSDTWTYDLSRNNWTELTPSSSPGARNFHSMVYNSKYDKVILFGGWGGFYLSDTWVYHLESNKWTNMNPGNPPNGRAEHSMVYDSNLDKVILFGGYNGTSRLNDTWVYDLDTNTWTEMNSLISPSARRGHTMIYHSREHKGVLFGGDDANPGYLDDTWVYDLETNTWTQKNALNPPYPRNHHAMTYEGHSSKVIVFGGTDRSEHDLTWSYDLNTNIWTPLAKIIEESVGSIAGLWWQYHTLAYDSYLEKVVYFGGYFPDNDDPRDVTFILDRNYHRKGIFTSQMFSFDNIYQISGNITWNPVIQPRDRELKVQLGFSNTTKDDDFQYIDYSSSGFAFRGLAQHIRYRVLFNSTEREYWTTIGLHTFREFSSLLTKINIDYTLEKPQPLIHISNPGNVSAVEGIITVSAIASSPNGIEKVCFYIGGLLHAIDYSSPFTCIWNSVDSDNGNVTLLVSAVSILGRENMASIQLLVDNPVELVPVISVSSTPQGLSASTGDNFVTLSWTAPTNDGGSPITRYRIYRGTSPGEYLLVGISTSTSFNDTLVIGNTTYFYVVTALNAVGESKFSDEVSVTPSGLTIPQVGSFPSMIAVIFFLGIFGLVIRKQKKL